SRVFTALRRVRSARAMAGRSAAGSSRSRAMWAAPSGSSASGLPTAAREPSAASTSGLVHNPPKRRWSTRSRRAPSSRWRERRRWRSGSEAGPSEAADGAAAGAPGVANRSWPLIPRWPISASPVSAPSGSASRHHRNLPRRATAVRALPSSAARNRSAPPAWRRMMRASSSSTSVIVRPRVRGARPRRTTSTSGSSGIRSAPRDEGLAALGEDPAHRVLRGGELGVLLRGAVAAGGDDPRHGDGGGVDLLVLETGLAERVGDVLPLGGGDLLQPGLEVVAGLEELVRVQQRPQQVQHEAAGDVLPEREVDGADHRLGGVGEDRSFRAPAGEVLPAAQA